MRRYTEMKKRFETLGQQQKLGWRGLSATMIMQMLLIALVPLVVVAAVVTISLSSSIANLEWGFLSARQEMTAELGKDLQGEAVVTLWAIETYMDERIHDAVEWASAPIVRQAARDAAARAQELGLCWWGQRRAMGVKP